jgi:hypothetical protein
MIGFRIQTTTKVQDKGANRILRQIESVGNGVTILTGIHKEEGTALPMYRGKPDGKVPVAKYADWQETGEPPHIPARPTFGPTVVNNANRFTKETAAGMRAIYNGSTTVRKLMGKMGRRTKDWLKTRIMVLKTPANAPSTLRQKRRLNRGSNPLIYSGTMHKSIKTKHKYPAAVKNMKLRTALRHLETAMKEVKP